jgi:anti-sigma regulatory factor (Ser/Thr protein kinase)
VSCDRVLPDALPPGDHVRERHHVHLDPVPRIVAEARRFVLAHAPDLPAETRDSLALLTSELVTNAVLHARTPIELGITIADESVLVTVHDLDLARREQAPYAGREGGWGLGLVAALADSSSMDSHPGDGKTAWFRLPRSGQAAVEDGAAERASSDGAPP